MRTYFKEYIRNIDYILLFVYIVLTLFGLVMVYSASQIVAIRMQEAAPDYFYNRQRLFILLSYVCFFAAAIVPYRKWRGVGFLMLSLVVLIGSLFAVLIVGNEINGSKSWISLGFMNFQPSEFAKLFLIIYLAGVFYNKSEKVDSIQLLKVNDIKEPVIVWFIVLLFVGLEPDLGAVGIIFVLVIGMIFASGLTGKTLKKFAGILSFFGMILIIIAIFLKKDAIFTQGRAGRLLSYRNPFEFADSLGFQVVNGYYAIGSGGLTGKGLGQSVQKLGYLPEPHTDFILAIIAEELGVFGVLIVLLGLGYITLRGFWIAANSKNVMARMLAAGVAMWIGTQTFINVGGLTGIIPLTGVTLPFISYGGSSILMLSIAVGILLNVSTYYKIEQKKS